MKPVIGLTTWGHQIANGDQASIHYDYVNSVKRAGGIPVPIPYVDDEEFLSEYITSTNMSGIIFTGGADIFPPLYGEDTGLYVNAVDTLRDSSEMKLFKIAIKNKIPIFGICRGLQFFNIALGGTLYQHIDAQVKDAIGHHPIGLPRDVLSHEIIIEKSGILYPNFNNTKTNVNSFHHQGIKKLAPDLVAIARSNDGLIEAIQGKDMDNNFILGVQWHPENLSLKYKEFLELFKLLIEKAAAKV
jgi:putative glutamine amidotransferase